VKDRIQLDWTRLLGFDQIAASRGRDGTRLVKAGLKPMSVESAGALGSKTGFKPNGPNAALGHRIGAKIGSKPGFKPLS
jgi:hypothetical protein